MQICIWLVAKCERGMWHSYPLFTDNLSCRQRSDNKQNFARSQSSVSRSWVLRSFAVIQKRLKTHQWAPLLELATHSFITNHISPFSKAAPPLGKEPVAAKYTSRRRPAHNEQPEQLFPAVLTWTFSYQRRINTQTAFIFAFHGGPTLLHRAIGYGSDALSEKQTNSPQSKPFQVIRHTHTSWNKKEYMQTLDWKNAMLQTESVQPPSLCPFTTHSTKNKILLEHSNFNQVAEERLQIVSKQEPGVIESNKGVDWLMKGAFIFRLTVKYSTHVFTGQVYRNEIPKSSKCLLILLLPWI